MNMCSICNVPYKTFGMHFCPPSIPVVILCKTWHLSCLWVAFYFNYMYVYAPKEHVVLFFIICFVNMLLFLNIMFVRFFSCWFYISPVHISIINKCYKGHVYKNVLCIHVYILVYISTCTFESFWGKYMGVQFPGYEHFNIARHC